LRRPTQICLLEWQLATLGNWSLHDCHYYQVSDNGIAPSPRQNRNKQGS
jgi:hypothetical protein